MKTLIVVDVQPFYKNYICFDVGSLITSMKKYDEVVIFFNGEELGCDTLEEVQFFFYENGMSEDINHITWVEKSYGFLRGWMDNVDDEDIVSVLSSMIEEDISDSRDLDESFLEKFDLPSDDCIYFPDFDLRRKYKEAAICGGGQNECLREMEMYFEAIGTETERIWSYVY